MLAWHEQWVGESAHHLPRRAAEPLRSGDWAQWSREARSTDGIAEWMIAFSFCVLFSLMPSTRCCRHPVAGMQTGARRSRLHPQ